MDNAPTPDLTPLVYWHTGDTLTTLRESFPDQSVQCVVTSPPYWGLRDYRTGRWEGGDPTCTHALKTKPRQDTTGSGVDKGRFAATRGTQPGKTAAIDSRQDFSTCATCGATRVDHQIGLEPSPEAYVDRMVEVFREVRRVLRDDGTVWLNVGDSYCNDTKWGGTTGGKHAKGLHGDPIGRTKRTTGLKQKDLLGLPWMLAFALRADGWYLRDRIIWAKAHEFCPGGVGSVMPESVRDRFVNAHEYIFLLTKSPRYYFDAEAATVPGVIAPGVQGAKGSGTREGNRRGGKVNGRPHVFADGLADLRTERGYHTYSGQRRLRNVWFLSPQPYKEAHFATFPPSLVDPCIRIGSRPGDWVLDPFCGSGTTLAMAQARGRHAAGIDLNPEYRQLWESTCARVQAYLRKPRPAQGDQRPETVPSAQPGGSAGGGAPAEGADAAEVADAPGDAAGDAAGGGVD